MRVVVDSSTCLDAREAAGAGVTVVPMHIVINGRSFRDLEEISPTDFYRSLRNGANGTHTTSSPSAGDYLAAFEAAPDDVLCLTVASAVSSMHQAAAVAARMAEGRRVEVIDTGTAAGGLRLLALRAARFAAAGGRLDEVADDTRRLASRIHMYGMLDTIDFLARSGRVPQVASWGSSLLGVKPVVRFQGGKGSLLKVVRGVHAGRRALEEVLASDAERDGVATDGRDLHATVFHADTPEEAGRLLEAIATRFPAADLSVSEFTPAMGVHTGPGLLGHAFYVEPPASGG